MLLSLETPESSKYYAYNEALDSDLGSDAIIISPKVEIIKDANGDLLDESVVVSVLTCAAPVLIYGFELSSQEEYEELLYKRIMGILKVSATYDYRYLVLGAWGCGAFGNNAEVVARLFYKALLEIEYDDSTKESMFAEIHFAVLDKSPDKYNFNSFNKYFNGNNFYMEEMLDASAD